VEERAEKERFMVGSALNDRRRACALLQAEFLADRAVIVVANRAPVTFLRNGDGELEFEFGVGELVTELTDVCRYSDVTWIGT
jgi:hypothetical protein